MIGGRIRKQRERLGWSQDELAQRLGYKSRSSINKMELGIQDVPQRRVREFANVLGVEISYLMEDDAENSGVPIYSCLSCGTGTWIDEQPEEYVGIPSYMMFSGRAFANPAEGDSMEPGIKSGDLLIFSASAGSRFRKRWSIQSERRLLLQTLQETERRQLLAFFRQQ